MSNLFGGGAKTASTTPTQAMGIQFNSSQYGPPVPVVYGTTKVGGSCVWYGDFKSTAQKSQSSGKGGGGSTTTGYTYSASFQLALCEGPIQGIGTVFSGTSTVSLGSVGAVVSTGTAGQSPWSHLSGGFALGYTQTALISVANLNLGSSASLPDWNPEVQGLCIFGNGIQDANPAAIVTDICTNGNHGINFPWVGDLTQYSNYCVANGLFLSPCYDQQQSAQQTLEDLFTYTNTAVWFSEGLLKAQPYGDLAVSGNGVIYTPDVTPLFDLGSGDFIVDPGDAPITVTRKSTANCQNMVQVQFNDRSNTYHTGMAVATIDQDVIANGARFLDTEDVDMCTSAAVARFIAQNMVQQAFYVRNTYEFKLGWRYCMLEPMDIVTLTDASTGLNEFPVRITEVAEDENGILSITAEEYPEGIGHSAIYNTQPNEGSSIDPNTDPGPVNPPYLFRGPGYLAQNTNPEIWIAVNGANPLWGAADIYLSTDGDSYTWVGTTAQPARYGALATTLPAGTSDPDTTHAPQVTLYTPGVLLGGSQADADNLVTLVMIDSELGSYQTATLTGTEQYQISYLRRGAYGSANVAHSAGAPFVRLDDGIFRMPVDASMIGETVYLKFVSINVFGRTPRTLAEETEYTYVVGTNNELPDVPDVPHNFATQGVADGIAITWTNDNPAAVGCTSIERATVSTGPFSVIAQVGPTSTGYTDQFTNGATYFYRARARGPLVSSGWSGYTDVLSSTGTDVDAISNAANQALATANTSQPAGIINPNFIQGLFGWTLPTSDPTSWYAETGTNGPNAGTTTYVVHVNDATTSYLINVARSPVYPGQTITATAQVRGLGNPTAQVGLILTWYDINGNELSWSGGAGTGGGGVNINTTLVTVGTAPENAAYVSIGPGCGYKTGSETSYYTFTNLGWTYSSNPQTIVEATTARTVSPSDVDNLIECTNTSGCVITIQPDSTMPMPVGSTLYAMQATTGGQVSFVGGTGVTFLPSDSDATREQGSIIAMKRISTDVWQACGDLAYYAPGYSVAMNAGATSAQPQFVSATMDGVAVSRRGGILGFYAPEATENQFAPVGSLASTNVAAALEELDQHDIQGLQTFAVAGGTSDALTAAFSPAITTLVDGQQLKVRALLANASTTPTLAVNSITAANITKKGNQPLAAGDIFGAGHELLLRYVAATPRFELLNPAVSATGASFDLGTLWAYL